MAHSNSRQKSMYQIFKIPMYPFIPSIDINKQTFDLPVLIFGSKFLSLGLRQKDRDINKRITLLRELAKDMIQKRLAQLEKQGPREKYQDIIEALVLKKSLSQDSSSNSSKVKIGKREADNYDFKQLIEEFCTFFTAETDTTSHFTQIMVFREIQWRTKDLNKEAPSLFTEQSSFNQIYEEVRQVYTSKEKLQISNKVFIRARTNEMAATK